MLFRGTSPPATGAYSCFVSARCRSNLHVVATRHAATAHNDGARLYLLFAHSRPTFPSQDLTAAEQRTKVIGKLHGILKPFVLRRVKADVAIDLPRKQEVVLYAQMTEEQKRLNQGLLQGTLAVSACKGHAHAMPCACLPGL